MSNKIRTHRGGIMGLNKPLIAGTKPVGISFRKGGPNSIVLMKSEQNQNRHHQQEYQNQNYNHNQLICQPSLKVVAGNTSTRTMDDDLNSRDFETRICRINHNTAFRSRATSISNSTDRPHISNNPQSVSFNQLLNTSARNKISTKMRLAKRNIVLSQLGEKWCLCLMMLTLVAIASSSGPWFVYSQILEITPNEVPAMINLATYPPTSIDTQQLSSLSSSLNSDPLKNSLFSNNNNINNINHDSINTSNSKNLTEALLAILGAANSFQSLVASKNLEPRSFNSDGFYQNDPESKQQHTTISTNKIEPQQNHQELQQKQQQQPVAETNQTPLVESQLVAPGVGSPQVETMVTAASKKKKKMMKKKKKMEKKHKEWKKGKKHKKKKYEHKKKKKGMSHKKKGKFV